VQHQRAREDAAASRECSTVLADVCRRPRLAATVGGFAGSRKLEDSSEF
jgi:hypothetical protein